MVKRSFARILVVTVLASTLVLSVATAAYALKKYHQTQQAFLRACSAAGGIGEASNGGGSCTGRADGTVQTCKFPPHSKTEKNCTSTKVQDSVSEGLEHLIAGELGLNVESDDTTTSTTEPLVIGKKNVNVKRWTFFHLNNLFAVCQRAGVEYYPTTYGGRCTIKNITIDCVEPPGAPDVENCYAYRKPKRDVIKIIRALFRRVDVLRDESDEPSQGNSGTPDSTTTSTTEGTKTTIPDPQGSTPPASGPSSSTTQPYQVG